MLYYEDGDPVLVTFSVGYLSVVERSKSVLGRTFSYFNRCVHRLLDMRRLPRGSIRMKTSGGRDGTGRDWRGLDPEKEGSHGNKKVMEPGGVPHSPK